MFKFLVFCTFVFTVTTEGTKQVIQTYAETISFPYYVTIFYGYSPQCSAVLISMFKIVTLARCFQYTFSSNFTARKDLDLSYTEAVVGLSDDLSPGKFTQRRTLKSVKIHSKFSMRFESYVANDIATANLVKPFTSAENVGPMKIVTEEPDKKWVFPENCFCFTIEMKERRSYETIKMLHAPKDICAGFKGVGEDEICTSSTDPKTYDILVGAPLICNGYVFGIFQQLYSNPFYSFSSLQNHIEFMDLHEAENVGTDGKSMKKNSSQPSHVGHFFSSHSLLFCTLLVTVCRLI